jgi:hypothetical protein
VYLVHGRQKVAQELHVELVTCAAQRNRTLK